MRSTCMFRDQVQQVTNWFKAWNQCEQTVALFSLLRKLGPIQTKFLLQVLEHNLSDLTEIYAAEIQANDPGHIAGLLQESKESAVGQLLTLLPLLHAGNVEAKQEYLKLLPCILNHSVENGCHIEESRQLLSYCLIHPAMDASERAGLTLWLSHLEEHFAYGSETTDGREQKACEDWQHSAGGSASEDSKPALGPRTTQPPPACPQTHYDGLDLNLNSTTGHTATHITLHPSLSFSGVPTSLVSASCNLSSPGNIGLHQHGIHRKLTRSLSAATPGSQVSDWLNKHHQEMVQDVVQASLIEGSHLLLDHAPLSPQSSLSSSGSSDGHHGDQQQLRNTFLEEGSGMRDVPVWLKGLRLHKYSYLFQTMTYDEMLNLTEGWLRTQDVTKGARNKIVLNIRKLQERPNILRVMEKEILEGGNIKQALTELKGMMNTPLKAVSSGAGKSERCEGEEGERSDRPPAPDPAMPTDGDSTTDDLPGMITRMLGKICTQLLVSVRLEDECFSLYLQLLDKCMIHEAFSVEQKRKLLSWRQQMQKVWHPVPQRYGLERPRKGFGNTFPPNVLRGHRAVRGQSVGAAVPKWTFSGHPASSVAQLGSGVPMFHHTTFSVPFLRPTVIDMKTPLARTHSAPIKSNQLGFTLGSRLGIEQTATEPEINARLDSLCLSMTEHALGNISDTLWSVTSNI